MLSIDIMTTAAKYSSLIPKISYKATKFNNMCDADSGIHHVINLTRYPPHTASDNSCGGGLGTRLTIGYMYMYVHAQLLHTCEYNGYTCRCLHCSYHTCSYAIHIQYTGRHFIITNPSLVLGHKSPLWQQALGMSLGASVGDEPRSKRWG